MNLSKFILSILVLSSPYLIASNISHGAYTSDEVGMCRAWVQIDNETLIIKWETINQDLYPNYSCQFSGKTVTYQYDRYDDEYQLSSNRNLYIRVLDSKSFVYGRKGLGAMRTEYEYSKADY